MKAFADAIVAPSTDASLFDALPLPAVIQDDTGRIMKANDAFCTLLGYSAGELAGADPIAMMHPDDHAERRAWRARTLALPPGQVVEDSRRFITKGGEVVWTRTHSRRHLMNGQLCWLSQLLDVTQTVARERTLLDAADQFRVLFRDSPVPMTLQNEAWELVAVNRAFCRYSGFEEAEVLGRDPIVYAHPDDRETFRQSRQQWEGEGGRLPEEVAVDRRLIRKDGRVAAYRLRARRLQDPAGGRLMLAVLEDKTDVREAEERAQRSALQLEQWFDLSPMGVVIRDSDWRVLRPNQALADLLGYSCEELVGMSDIFLRAAEGEDAEGALRARRTMDERGGDTVRVSGRLRRKDGQLVWTNRLTRAMQDAQGQRIYLTIVDDVTKERLFEQQLERALAELEVLFNHSAVGIVHSRQGRIVRINAYLERMLGYRAGELDDKPVRTYCDPQEPARIESMAPGEESLHYSFETVLVAKDGRRVPVLVHGSPVRAGDPEAGSIVAYVDISDRRAAQQALIESEVRFRMFAENTDREFFIAERRGGGLLYLNAASEQFWGFPRASMLLEPQLRRSRVAPESLAAYDALAEDGRAGQPAERVFRIVHPQRGERWFSTRIEPAQLPSGQHVVYGITADITERQLQQSRLEQLLLEMSAMMEGTEAGIVYLREGKVVRCNSQLERLFGFRSGTIVGRPLEFPHEPRDASESMVQEMGAQLRRMETYGLQREFRRVDGSRIWCSVWARSAEPFRPEAGVIAVLVDITLLKNQEARLRGALTEQELMFSVSDVGIAFVRDGAIVRANAALHSMSGYADDELTGLNAQVLHPPASEAEAADEASQDDSQAVPAEPGEIRMRRKDGTLFWVRRAMRAVQPGSAQAGQILTYIDIDGKRRADAERRRALQQLQLIFDSVFVGMVYVSEDGVILRANRTMERMFAYEPGELEGRSYSALQTSAAQDQATRRILNALTEQGVASFEYEFSRKDGSRFWVAGNAVAVNEASGRRQYIVAFLDIDQRKRSEEELQATREFLDQLFESIPVGVTVRDAHDLRAIRCNKAAAEMLGLPPEQVIGRRRADTYADPEGSLLDEEDRQVVASGQPLEREHSLRLTSDGGDRVFRMRTVPIGGGGQVRHVMTVTEDVTEHRAAEQRRLDEAIKQRDLLVREVHHRIKNNLQGVAGLLQQIAMSRPALAEALGEIAGQVQAIAQIHGLQVRHSGELAARSVILAIWESLQRTFGVTVQVEAVPAVPGHGLPEQEAVPLALTVNELGTNAIKHRADGAAAVHCRLEESAAGLTVEIRNPGRLAPDFDFASYPPGASGLGLIKALLPRRGARLQFTQDGDEVVVRLELTAPAVLLAGG
jgi:PAS domain S-box-containing protein